MENKPKVFSTPELSARLVVVETIYHQVSGQKPKQVSFDYTWSLQSTEQVYERRCKATEEWQQVDTGWNGDNTSEIIIINDAGKNLQVNQTPEEQAIIDASVLELSFQEESFFWLVCPGCTFHGFPSKASALHIRSRVGVVDYTIYSIPE